jgi:beta-lactamase class A
MGLVWRKVACGCALGAALGVVGAGASFAQTGTGADAGLQAQVEAIAAAHHGKVSVWAEQLKTGKTVALNADEEVQTASVIKLAILYDAMAEVSEGKARWDERITLKPGEAVSGSGLLLFLDTPVTLTLKDMLTLMVIMSDNTATNLAIDRFGIDPVNARIAAQGLMHTHLYKKVMKLATGPMPADQPKFGLGKTTAREMGTLMGWIGECKLHSKGAVESVEALSFAPATDADKAACEVGLKMLKGQFYRDTVPRYLPGAGDQTVASKTGSLNAVRNDVSIVAGKSGPMVLSIFTYENKDQSWTADNEGEITIAKIAKTIVGAWSPAGLDGKDLVPGLGLGAAAVGQAAAGGNP